MMVLPCPDRISELSSPKLVILLRFNEMFNEEFHLKVFVVIFAVFNSNSSPQLSTFPTLSIILAKPVIKDTGALSNRSLVVFL